MPTTNSGSHRFHVNSGDSGPSLIRAIRAHNQIGLATFKSGALPIRMDSAVDVILRSDPTEVNFGNRAVPTS